MMRDAVQLRRPVWLGMLCAGLACATMAVFAPAAQAQAPGTSLGTNFTANADKPIDIQADMLEVDDNKKVATFKGNVSATQGDFNMKSRELIVSYTTAKSDNKTAAPQGAVPGGNGEINEINAKGNVVITTKDGQEATGDAALYQVKNQLVFLTGDVKVKQSGNVIACEKVTVNLGTGITTMVPKDRVKAIFQPKSQEK